MKTASILMVILVVSLSRLPAAQVIAPINGHADLPPPTKYRMVEQGADHNVWQRETFEQAPSGQIVSKIHKYTELATGLNYQDAQGQWQPSQEAIETYAGGAIARQGQYQVIFADNLNTEGAIDLQTPDKKRLRSNILGLGYYDHSSGQAVLIAQLQDSEGQLIASNQVLYPNAFQGVAADVRYTYKKGKFEQDVILREQPPTPETYGMNPATTELEVMTEFLNPPAAKISGRSAAKGVESDGEISWGTMAIGHGKAFDLGESKKLHSQVSVTKQYAVVDGRQVLIEMVPVTEIQSSLRKLPVQTSTQRRLPFSVTKARKLPKTPLAKASGQPMQLASLTPANQGYVLDYTAITSTTNNFTFQGDTTYYVGGAYYLNGLTTIEGGTVIKMDGSGELIVVGDGVIDCQTSAYHPGVFTSVNDNSVGEPFGSGTPGLDVSGFLDFNSTNAALHDLRFSYSWISIEQDYGQMDVWDSQFMNVDAAVFGYNVGLHNVLIGRSVIADAAVFSEGPSLVAENVTSDGGYAFFEADYFGGTVALTNCLVTGQLLISSGGYTTPPSTNAVVCLPSPSVPVYQKIGGGFYYLTNSSPYRDVGTTNISPDLLADLAAKTTYPPIAYSNATFTTAMTFSPQAQRDNDGLPDLGYHYDPLDQLFVNSSTSSNLLFTAGTAAAWTTSEGMHLTAQVTATFAGTAISPNYWVRANVVQEQDGNADYGAGGMVSWYSPYPVNAPTVQATFAHFSELAGYGNPFRDDAGFLILSVTNCEFWTCGEGGYGIGLTLKNCLFDRSYIGVQANCCAWLTMQNCTMRGRTLLTTHWGDWPVSITNCAFDGADLSGMDGSDNSCDYNAFLSGASLLPSEGVHTNIVTSFNWKSSWLGNFYLPTNSPLINKGNTTANQVGLYYFTTQTNQAEEANSQVDVGYHYVATDGSGHPWMTMTNGVPDYLADTDGNGLPDFWEIQYFGHISVDPKADPDYDGANNLQEYLAGTNPNDASSVPALALGRWRFDNTNTWVGDAGQLPLATSNLVGLASWNTNAVLMDTNSSSLLKYRDVETNGHANINLHSGTVRFWFKSDWNSVNQGGSGPATPGRLLEVGNYLPTFTNGWWSLYLNPAGTQLFFATSTNGAGMTNLAANIDWTSNQWHQVALTYTSTNTSLYLDGSLATNGTGALYYPNATERTNGFRLGSDAAGSEQAKGQFDELETFNYPLNASDISSNYQALVDKNGNGLADYWELQNFGHLGVDPNSDPDGDGLSNLEEYENGTNPNHFDAVRLGHWRFDDPPVWSDDNGLLPANTYHVLSLPSWLGMAVKLNPVQAGVLAYPSRRPDGSTVMICSNGVGSIRFWFKPDWASTTAGGNGPGDLVRLLEVGHATSDASYGWFALTVNSFGTKLDFETEANGVHTDNTTATINFNPQNWYQVVLTYTPSNSAVYVNGVALMNGAGVTNLCLQAINGLPFNLGSSWDGIHQANGSFDELETFNYALPASDVAANYQTIMNVDTDGDGLSDVQEDAQRTRLDAMDSDCDGIPDGWEVYHGMNPSDTSDATAEKLKEYMGIFATNATAGTYLGTQTIGIFSGPSSASFGSFPAGNYTVRYIDGAWSCATGDWAVEVIISEISSNTYSITAGYNAGLGKDSGRATFPGPVDRYSSYDDAQTAALGEMTYFYHQGGDISMMFVDKPYDDNFTEGATPTYELYTANPALTINEANVSWLNATQCLATFTILNNTSQTFSGLTVGLRDESGVVDGSGAVTNWTIASYNTASVTFTLVATPSMLNRFTATIDFDGGTNIYPSVITVPMLEARPGKQAVYLVWPPIPSATTYSVYQSIGSTNNWTLLGTTDNLNYQNTNLTVGTTYFYKVSANGVTNISDGTVPFGCPDPLPPILNYMNPLEVPADNGSYTIAYAMLLTNSDAFDPQGYSMVFKIEKVLTGSLMINGSPAGPGNDTIGTSDSVVWTPPAVMVASGTPALRVYVYDGLNASTNKVDVIIQQHPATHLMAWGQNWNQNWNDDTIAGTLLGTGSWHVASGKPIDTDFANEPVFLCQNLFNICPEDPRWTLSETNNWTAQYIGDPPAPVLDLDKATSVASFQSGHAAVTPDKQLWFWGECYSYATGRPLVFGVHTGESTPFIVTNWSTSLNWTTNSWGLLALTLPSPTPVLDPQTGLPMTGVVVAQDDFILKGDGTLWSFGWLNEKLGREVTDPNQIFSAANGLNAIYPGRVEFEGNDDNEVLPGREIAAVCANSGGRDIASGLQGLALCKDGSLWSWGRLCENGSYYFQLSDSMDYAQPARLFDVESASSSPIAQIKESQNHIVIQRQDGSLSELGYIPMWDTNRMFIRNPHDAAGIYSTISDGTPDGSVCYRTIPVVVSNVPANIKQFGVAPSYGVILTESGEVWVWGQWLGQIWPTPHQIPSLAGIIKIAVGQNYIVALDSKGRLWGIGINSFGIFGFNDTYPGPDVSDRGPDFPGVSAHGIIYTNAVRVQGIENVTDIYVGDKDWVSQMYAIGSEIQGKPVGLSALSMNQSVSLSWSNYPAASSYVIYRSISEDGGYAAIGTATVNSYQDRTPPLVNDKIYYYQVSAVVNGIETMPSWDVAATPLPPPKSVQNLMAVDECHAVTLSWEPPLNAAQSPPEEYRIDRADAVNGTYLAIDHNLSGATVYEDITVVAGHTYYYHVVTVNSAGESAGNTAVSGEIDDSTCATSPLISTNWMPNSPGNSWFTVSPPNPYNLYDPNAYGNLCWTGPQAGTWLYAANQVATNRFDNNFLYNLWYYQYSAPGDNIYGFLLSQVSLSDSNTLVDLSISYAEKLPIVLGTLNHLLTNGTSLYSFSPFNTITLRTATVTLKNTSPTGANLVQLNRMLLDDALINDQSFMTGPAWGDDLTGFRVYYRYVFPNGKNSLLLSRDVTLNQVLTNDTARRLFRYDDPLPVVCYQFRWPILDGAQYWASVAAIIGNQVGNTSIEAGPLASSIDPGGWQNVRPRVISGYHQVYLDWPDDSTLLNFTVKATALPPSADANSGSFDYLPDVWVGLSTNQTDVRYWHVSTPTNFTLVDFKYPTDLANRLVNGLDLVSTLVWTNFSPSAQDGLSNAYINSDSTQARTNLAAELTRIIQNGSLIFTTNQAGMVAADLSTQTRALLARHDASDPTFTAADLATLNRLLLEDAYVVDIARYETPSPVEFVSGDFNAIEMSSLLATKFANYGSPPVSDHMGSLLWNWLSPTATNEIMAHWNDGSATNILAMQRLLAKELTRIIQTNAILFTTNDVVNYYGWGVSRRAMELAQHTNTLGTNEISLLNRLLLQDAWNSYGVNNYGVYPYSYVEPLSDLRCYWIEAYFCDYGYPLLSDWAQARPDDRALPPPSLSFSADAFAYDSMTLVQWNTPGATNPVPGSDTTWQFSVERREGSAGAYANVTKTGFGLAYSDVDVLNDHAYQYRVTAYDTNYNRYQAETSLVTPANSASLTLFDPQPGNGYVDLSWTPIRATQFTVMHSTSPDGPFESVAVLNGQNAYQNAQSTYRHVGVLNGVIHYYKIVALTPTGAELDSDVKSATPLPTLATLPPDNFQGQFLPDDASGQIILSWTPRSGATSYQVFLSDQTRFTPLSGYNGLSSSCNYIIPIGTPANTVFTFAVRSINAQNLAGDLVTTIVTNLPIYNSRNVTNPVVLQVADFSGTTTLMVLAPTNLTLSATVSVPSVDQVNFYDNGQIIGTVGAPYQMTWYHVPAGLHSITAAATVQSDAFYGGSSPQTFTSDPVGVNAIVAPELSAYQTSATDLQLPAPALPISLARSYTSRSTDTNGI
ncbi:MAG TPA: LamG-like jellyroll fold domain-containing protein, partial [Verrucomicrobiae bacterium]